jgi:hypothetical protein
VWGGLTVSRQKYQCDSCRFARYRLVRGELHPNFNLNFPVEDRKNRPVEVMHWYKAVLRAYNYTCVVTGHIGAPLSAHHLNSYKWFPEQRFVVANGVCLRRDVHKLFHHRYGRVQNTLEQFKEFYKAETKNEFIPLCIEQ